MLNDAKVKAAKPKEKAYKLGDSGQLYLFVAPTGVRSWRMNYTFGRNAKGNPQQKTLTLGTYPAMTLLQARGARDTAKDQLRLGHDPSVQRKVTIRANADASAHTFEIVARDWHNKQKVRWSAIHSRDVLTSLEENIFPAIGPLPIAAIKAPKLLEILTAVEKRGAVETAHRLRSRLSSIFVFALASGLVEADPAASLGKALSPKPRSKKQPAITTLEGLRQVLVDAEAERCRATTKFGLRFLALTAVRPGELRFSTWEEFEGIDWETEDECPEAVWRIPAERMKGDLERKDEREGDHLVPLATQSVHLLRVLHRLTGDLPHLFPSERHPHRPLSENTLRALLIRAGYYQRHVPHGFRAAFSTIMNERAKEQKNDGDRAVIDLMLAHIPQGTSGSEGSYNRAAYLTRRRQLAQEWADILVGDFWPPEIHLGQPIRYMPTGPGRA